jgi:hypothetical protein
LAIGDLGGLGIQEFTNSPSHQVTNWFGRMYAPPIEMAENTKRGGQEYPITKRQEEGYDEAAHGGKDVPASDVGIPANPGDSVGGDEFDRAGREAANDVRRQEHSAD